MNVYDSARMADVLAVIGYGACESAEDADLVILNTCHIREKAAEKVYSELGRLDRMRRARRRAGRDMLIAVAGCVAQAEGTEVARRAPGVDLVVGPQTYHHLPRMLAQSREAKARGAKATVIDTEFPADDKFAHLGDVAGRRGASAFLTVQEGCDRFCSFCVVPYTRGTEFSRRLPEIEAEARHLVASGAVEITLLGQNVNAYHGIGENGEPGSLAQLMRRLDEIDGLARLRYTTSHPADMSDDLIAAHGEIASLMPFLHLPVQSGSDRVLRAMNRRHKAGDYLRIVERLRAARPDLALSSDFIVGFPGESDADFEATLALVRAVGFAQAYSFKYSPRPGTPAAERADQVPEPIKAERLARLQAELDGQQRRFNIACLGRVVPVLFDRPGRQPAQVLGRSPYMQAVHMDMPDDRAARACMGRVIDVELTEALANSLSARPVDTREAGL